MGEVPRLLLPGDVPRRTAPRGMPSLCLQRPAREVAPTSFRGGLVLGSTGQEPCEDRVLDGPAPGEKGSKGRSQPGWTISMRSFRFFELPA